MEIPSRRPTVWAVLACAGLCACGSSRLGTDAASSSGGREGSVGDGGATGVAGTTGSGGTGGANATPGTGGTVGGTGGPASGGSPGSGGASSTGGTPGSAAAGGSAGAPGPAGASGAAGAANPSGGATGGLAKLRLFYLDVTGGRVLTASAQNPSAKVLVASTGQGPDGVAVDVAGGHVYWTGMGNP